MARIIGLCWTVRQSTDAKEKIGRSLRGTATRRRIRSDLDPLIELRERLRSRGALLAVDDAGSGYSGLQQIAAIKPQMVKLDRAIVSGVDGDEVKLALTELLGEFAGRIDAWLLAEGIEAWG